MGNSNIRPIRIGAQSPVSLNTNLILAPMSGVTTSPFRRLIKELNPGLVGLVITEFISVEALTRNVNKSLEMMKFHQMERPFGIQIFGHDIERLQHGALMAQDAGAEIIDLNCGCPAPKVVRKGGGCELMRQTAHLAKILSAMRKVIKIPFSMKFRSGWDESSLNARNIALLAQEEGLDGVKIHGRTRSQLYRGEADWGVVREIAEELRIPVFGSGDIVDQSSLEVRMGASAISGAMIGRGALFNPYIFSDLAGISVSGRLTELEIVGRYIDLLSESFTPFAAAGKVKQLASQMMKKSVLRKKICVSRDLGEIQDILKYGVDNCSVDTINSEQAHGQGLI